MFEFTYGTGWLICFLWGVYSLIMDVVASHNVAAKNMKKLGKYYALGGKGYTELEPTGWLGWIVTEFISLVLFPLLSWVGVAINLVYTALQYQKRSGMPERVKEYLWKIKNIPMSEEQLYVAGFQVEGISEEAVRRRVKEAWANMADVDEFDAELRKPGVHGFLAHIGITDEDIAKARRSRRYEDGLDAEDEDDE